MAPRLKPLKDEKEISQVPVTEPVLVEIALPPSGLEQEPPADGQQQQKPIVREPEQQDDGGAAKLQRDLETMKAADKIRQDEVTRERKRADDAIKQVQERDRQLADERAHREQAVTDNITSALSGAQAEQASAEQEYVAAAQNQDYAAMAKAQSKISRAAAKVLNYEAAAAELDDRRKAAEIDSQRRPQPQAPQPVDVVTAINTNPGLMQTERDWLLKHQEVLVDRKKGILMEAAYIRAVDAGHSRGTDEYFKFLDRELGFSKPPPKTEERTDDEEESTIMAAPVSRDNVSPSNGQSQQSNRVVLTPEQRDFAKSMGVSELDYARNVLKLRADKKSNPDRYRA